MTLKAISVSVFWVPKIATTTSQQMQIKTIKEPFVNRLAKQNKKLSVQTNEAALIGVYTRLLYGRAVRRAAVRRKSVESARRAK